MLNWNLGADFQALRCPAAPAKGDFGDELAGDLELAGPQRDSLRAVRRKAVVAGRSEVLNAG